MDKFVIFHIDGGCGKNIVATAVIRSIKNAYPEHKIIVVTSYPEVFIHNPNIYRVYKFGILPYFYEDYIENKNSVILRMEPYHSGDLLYKRKHLSEIWCDINQIKCITKIPEIYITQREQIFVENVIKKDGPTLLLQTSGGAENQQYPYSWARDFSPDFAQDIVNSLKDKFARIYHIRRDNQPQLENVISVQDNFRNLFCMINLADKILGIDSFMQHAAAALNKKATVGWISNSPIVFGHEMHDNIIASGVNSFRHKIDSYLENDDWTGSKLHECPFENTYNIFDKDQIIESILGSKTELFFESQPSIIF